MKPSDQNAGTMMNLNHEKLLILLSAPSFKHRVRQLVSHPIIRGMLSSNAVRLRHQMTVLVVVWRKELVMQATIAINPSGGLAIVGCGEVLRCGLSVDFIQNSSEDCW